MSDELFTKINRPGPEPTPMSQKHCATLCICDEPKANQPFQIQFRVGSIPHPMENEHAIHFVEFFVNDLYVARVDLIPVVGQPEGMLSFQLPAGTWKLSAIARCNLHGLWQSEKTIQIV